MIITKIKKSDKRYLIVSLLKDYVFHFTAASGAEAKQNELLLQLLSTKLKENNKKLLNNKDFVLDAKGFTKLIRYYYPYLLKDEFSDKYISQVLQNILKKFKEDSAYFKEYLFDSLGVSNQETTMLILFRLNVEDSHMDVIQISNTDLEFLNRDEKVSEILSLTYDIVEECDDAFDLGQFFNDEENLHPIEFIKEIRELEGIDEETIEIINEFSQRIAEIKDQGQLVFLVPFIKHILKEKVQKSIFSRQISLEIDDDFRIWIPKVNAELKMNALTKSIYFLFLQHKSIDLVNLNDYGDDLYHIYLNVSNLSDTVQMKSTVSSIVNYKTKAIFPHLSRIKSGFYKILDADFAQDFIISGNGLYKRKIKLQEHQLSFTKDFENLIYYQ